MIIHWSAKNVCNIWFESMRFWNSTQPSCWGVLEDFPKTVVREFLQRWQTMEWRVPDCRNHPNWDENNMNLEAFLSAQTAVCILLHFPARHCPEFPLSGCQTSLRVCGEACSTQAQWQQHKFATVSGSPSTTKTQNDLHLEKASSGHNQQSLKWIFVFRWPVYSFNTHIPLQSPHVTDTAHTTSVTICCFLYVLFPQKSSSKTNFAKQATGQGSEASQPAQPPRRTKVILMKFSTNVI